MMAKKNLSRIANDSVDAFLNMERLGWNVIGGHYHRKIHQKKQGSRCKMKTTFTFVQLTEVI